MNTPPFLSIVIPTRDRPQLLKHALWSCLQQSDQDFEVIVCDNPKNTSARSIFDETVGDHPNFHYFLADNELNMVDNWNRGIDQASGNYVTLLEDKFALRLDCIEALKEITKNKSPEIISWYPDIFRPKDEQQSCDQGIYKERHPIDLTPCPFDPFLIMEKRLACDTVRGTEGGMYGMGKILFGAFHRILIDRIIKKTGKLFHPFAPDYTSMSAALLLSKSAIDIGRSLCITVSTNLSNGALCQGHVRHAEAFLKSYGSLDSVHKQLPIPNLSTPAHNMVAHDYLSLCQQLPNESQTLKFNWSGLYLQSEKELKLVKWTSDQQKKEHYKLLRDGAQSFPTKHRLAIKLRNAIKIIPLKISKPLVQQIEKLLYRLEGKPAIHPESELWKRWTSDVIYHDLAIAPLGLDASLLYLYFRDRAARQNTLHEPASIPMNTEKPEKTPAISSLIQSLDPAVSSLIDNLISQITLLESEEIKKNTGDRISQLEDKLENFRGMISRRDKRILKLEKKVLSKK
ncbi:MAG: glycosyltransferase [Verrucomicrobiota bacterium]